MNPRHLLPLLLWFALSAFTGAQKIPNEPKLDLEKLVAATKGAIFSIKSTRPGLDAGDVVIHRGFFISSAGQAVCSLHAFDAGAFTATMGPEDSPVSITSVLAADLPSGFAIVATDQRPKAWLQLPAEDVSLGATIVILRDKVAGGALTAPVLARRKVYVARSGTYAESLSLGANLGPQASKSAPAGTPLLDRNGVIAGCISGPSLAGSQRLLLAVPGTTLSRLAAEVRKKPKPVPFPLPASLAPHDPVSQNLSYIQGRNAQIAKDFLNAERLLRKSLQRQPKSALAWQRLGLVLRDLGRDDEALHAFEQAAKFGEDIGSFQIMHAEQLRIMKRYPKALQLLKAACDAGPFDYELQRAYGVALGFNKDQAGAEKHLRLATRLAPDIISNWEVLGKCLGAQGKWDAEKIISARIYELEDLYRMR